MTTCFAPNSQYNGLLQMVGHECIQKQCKNVTDVRSNQNALTSKAHELGLGLPLKLDATVKMVTGATAELTEEQ